MKLPTIAAFSMLLWASPIGNAPSAFGDVVDEANWNRLRSMSVHQRLALAEKLKSFDLLAADEKQLIRELDDHVQKLPPQNREEAYSVMRRYHLWMSTLTEAERNELNALPSNQRMERIRRLHKTQKSNTVDSSNGFHPTGFGNHSPYEMATQIRVWFSLTPERKTALLGIKEDDRAKKLNEYRQALKIPTVPRPALSPADERAALDRWKEFRKEYDTPFLKKFDDPSNEDLQEKKKRRLRRLSELLVFEDLAVEKVPIDRLTDFAVRMPPWFKPLFDALSPEMARQQLTHLYRLVFEFPNELPPIKPAGKPATKGAKGADGVKGATPKAAPGTPPSAPEVKDAKPPTADQPF